MKILAIIPARGGSKGIPRKNIKPLLGRPLIAYSAEAALKCMDLIDRVVVSTEDQEIADVSLELGIEVPFLRPQEMAQDTSPSFDLVTYTLERLEKETGTRYDAVLLLQPTNPLRLECDIRESVRLLKENECDSVISVVRIIKEHPAYMKKISEAGLLEDFCIPEAEGTRRQDFRPYAYKRDGSIYLTRTNYVREHKRLFGKKIIPLVIPAERGIGIDDEFDWILIEEMLRRRAPQNT